MSKFYFIPNSKDLSKFEEELILPVFNYSIGFDVYFTFEEIESISKNRSVNVIINKFLHKNDLDNVVNLLLSMKNVKLFFVEDLGITNLIDKSRIVLFQNHIINNYGSINSFKSLGISNVVVSNELTIDELIDIRSNTSSNLFYFLVNRNMLMYSKRKLISSYYDYKKIKSGNSSNVIVEKVSGRPLIIKEEGNSTVIFDKNIFSANKFINELSDFNFVINFSNLSSRETDILLKHYKESNLKDYLEVDDYFLINKIFYKVGDIK
jgi:hypothetical protein